MAGVNCPKVDGSDLSRVLVKKAPDTRNAALIMGMSHFCNASFINGMDTWRGVRTKKYAYARYEDQTPWLLSEAGDAENTQKL